MSESTGSNQSVVPVKLLQQGRLAGNRYTHFLILTCFVAWLFSAINPYDPQTWLLEQIAAIAVVFLLWRSSRRVSFSKATLTGLTLLFVAHTVGTHFTYSLTPYDGFVQTWFGFSIDELFGFERNHYDRFVHFAFGVALALPCYEYARDILRLPFAGAWFVSGLLNLSLSSVYELMEWIAALVFADETGAHYLGAQGDIWDAQIDIALALLGFVLVWLAALALKPQTTDSSPDSQ